MLSSNGGHQHGGRKSLAKSFRCSIGRLIHENRVRGWVIRTYLKVTKHHLKLKLRRIQNKMAYMGYLIFYTWWDTFKLRFFSLSVWCERYSGYLGHFFFLNNFIYLFCLHWVFVSQAPLVVVSWSYSLVVMCRLLIGWLLLWSTGSRVCGLQ